MKNLGLGIFIFIFGLQLFAADFLSVGERKLILKEIDSICGDTWCEGDLEFNFSEFYCDKESRSCKLELTSWIRSEEADTKVDRSCTFNEIVSFSQLIDIKNYVDDEGKIFSSADLNDDFYLNLTEHCVYDI